MSTDDPQNAFPDGPAALGAGQVVVISSVGFPDTGPKSPISRLIAVQT